MNFKLPKYHGAAAVWTSDPSFINDFSYHEMYWDTTVWDTDGFWSAGNTSVFTIKFAGVYEIIGLIGTTTSGSGDLALAVYKNGSFFDAEQMGMNGNYHGVTQVTVQDLAKPTDYYQLRYAAQYSGTTIFDHTAGYFAISKLS